MELQTIDTKALKEELKRRTPVREYVVSCIWSGYQSGRERECCVMLMKPKAALSLMKVYAIAFTDGTQMTVHVRPRQPREKVRSYGGYERLLQKCADSGKTGTVSVLDLGE